MQKVDGKDIAWLLRCKECYKTLKIKDVKETIKGDFKMGGWRWLALNYWTIFDIKF